MWVYKQSEPELSTVGFYQPDGAWCAESDHGSTAEAAARVNFLNGGPGIAGAVPGDSALGKNLLEIFARITELDRCAQAQSGALAEFEVKLEELAGKLSDHADPV